MNSQGDFGYIVLDTVEFYLHRSRPLPQYFPSVSSSEELFTLSLLDTHVQDIRILTFCFVLDYGTSNTFGKDKEVIKINTLYDTNLLREIFGLDM